MKNQTLSSSGLANIDISWKNNLVEKVSLAGMAVFLLILSVMDCKVNDKFTLHAYAAENAASAGKAQDYFSMFNFQDRSDAAFGRGSGTHKQTAANLKRKVKNKIQYAGFKSQDDDLKNASLKPVAKKMLAKKKTRKIVNPLIVTNTTVGIQRKTTFGLEVGISQNRFYKSPAQNSPTNGLIAGLVVNVKLNKHLSLQSGIRYIEKGTEQQSYSLCSSCTGLNNLSVNKINMQYVEVPVNIVYKFGKIGKARVFAGGGPYMGWLIKTQNKVQTSTSTNATNDAVNTTSNTVPVSAGENNTKKLDYGVNGFIGCEIPEGFFAKAGIEAGLRDLQQGENGNYSGRNCNVTITIGYILGGNK